MILIIIVLNNNNKGKENALKTIKDNNRSKKAATTIPTPNNHERVNINDFMNTYRSSIPEEFRINLYKRIMHGFDYADIPKKIIDETKANRAEFLAHENLLYKCAELNNLGIEYEKKGNIKMAIQAYEENIELGYPATHSYDRLIVLYRKEKDYENEKRILKSAIDLFSKENDMRAQNAIDNNIEYVEEIQNAYLENKAYYNFSQKFNRNMYIYNPHNITKYKDRLNKVEQLITKN